MSLDEAGSADGARAESYRAAARAAVAELDEIEAVALALQARLAKLRTRARSLTALLDALQEVVPDAVRVTVRAPGGASADDGLPVLSGVVRAGAVPGASQASQISFIPA
jgi:hypothetical protein